MKKVTAEDAVNWFFEGGYKEIAKNPKAPVQSAIGSAFIRLMRASELMQLKPADVLVITLEGKLNGKKKG